jgi:hypothetical protein
MAKVYALFYDFEEGGDRENWNVFYTPLEIFTDKAVRDARKDYIESTYPDLTCECRDLDVTTTMDADIEDSYKPYEDDE